MKFLAFIFAFTLFGQSLSVCGPKLYSDAKKSEGTVCQITAEDAGHETLSKCCRKALRSQEDQNPQQDENEDHDCCGDNCKCFCCVKLFVRSHFYATPLLLQKPLVVKNIFAVLFHSFDYHSDSFHPPQLG